MNLRLDTRVNINVKKTIFTANVKPKQNKIKVYYKIKVNESIKQISA